MTLHEEQRTGPPEVLADGRVVFRLDAPDAQSVQVRNRSGGCSDWPQGNELDMTRDEQGTWIVIVGPLAPEYYTYEFIVDGVVMLDPVNAFVFPAGVHYVSVFSVPGTEAANLDVNDVPHGTMAHVWYPSPTLGMARRMVVYTPPDYESSDARYPVLYLLHGGGDDENGWPSVGRAAQIMDNLIAQGKCLPMIVVMPNGHANMQAARDLITPPTVPGGGRPARGAHIPQIPDSLALDLVPFVDKTYRTLADRESRAIAGLSMGGAQALYTGFSHLETFAWLGCFSAGLPLMPGVAPETPAQANADATRGPNIPHAVDPERLARLLPHLDPSANERLRLFYLSMGDEDFLLGAHQTTKALLDERGVAYHLVERPGFGHEYRFWRICLADLAGRLFQA